jgi:hypothetical protein
VPPRVAAHARFEPAQATRLDDLVAEVFGARADLVAEDAPPSASSPQALIRFTPAHARATVEASSQICCLLAAATAEDEPVTAHLVRDAAGALVARAERLSPQPETVTNGDFPPYIPGS